MGIGIYTAPNSESALSGDGTFTNPLGVTFDGRVGGTKEIRLYVRNDDPGFYFTDISLELLDTGDNIINRPDDGYVWKLSEGDAQPSNNDWGNIAPANTITFTNLGAVSSPDSSTYLPFWLLIEVPPGLDVQVFDGVQFQLSADRNIA